MDIIQNIIPGISLAAPLGPTTVEIIKRGIKHGFWSAFLVQLGAVGADLTHLLIIYIGLSPLVNFQWTKIILWLLGAVVLIYIGFQSLLEFFKKQNIMDININEKRSSFMAGYLITVFNPMAIVWWVGVFGAVFVSTLETLPKLLALANSLSIVLGALIWGTFLAILFHWGKRFVNQKTTSYITAIAGLILIGFGIFFGYKAIVNIF